MKKKYLVNGLAVLALTLTATSCSNDDLFTASDGLDNAEEVLGLTIDPNQDWKMTTQVTANISVKLGISQDYTVVVYDKNPFVNKDASYFLRQTVAEGGTISQSFSIPKANTQLYVVAFDSKHRSLVKQVNVTGNAIVANFGEEETTRSASPWPSMMTRAIDPQHDFSADIPEKPTTTEMDDANFFDAVPAVDYYSDINGGNGFASGTCYIDSNVNNINIWGGGHYDPDKNAWVAEGGTVYVVGNCDFSNKQFSLAANSTVYLVKDATLTLQNGFSSGTKVYLSTGSKLVVKNGISTGNICYYSKGGTIEAQSSMVINGDCELFMEGGNLKVGGLFQLEPAKCVLTNTNVDIDGKIDVNHKWISNERPNVAGIYYQDGGTFADTGSELVCNSGIFYINVNSKFSSIEANETGIIVNKAGTMTSTSTVRVTNGNSILINDGDLVATYLGTEGSALFENNGNTVISGNTVVNSNNNTWVNNGQYKTQYFIYNAGSSEVINNCHMVVDEDFNINLGDNPGDGCFRMDAGASVETKNFNGGKYGTFGGGPFYIYMGAKSLFKVTETATMCATEANYGIYGPETGGFESFAVFQAKDIVAGAGNQGYLVTYGYNLAVVCETHFEQGSSGQYPYIDYKGNATIYSDGIEPMNVVAIPQSTCNPGYTPGEPEEVPEIPGEPGEWTFAFEDNFVGDYDLNDVVLRVKENAENPNKIDVTLCATGASFNLYVYLDVPDNTLGRTTTRTLSMFNQEEVHAAMGQTAGKFVNTGSGSDKFVSGVAPVTYTFDKPSADFDIATADFWIKSPQGNIHVGTTYGTGTAPYGLIIPGKWRWPKEWNTITGNSEISAPYPRFANFAADKNQDTDWYKDFDPDLVY